MSTPLRPTVFGKVHLGYAVSKPTSSSDWKRFGHDAIGMHLDDMAPDTIRFRLDDNECRLLLRRGPAEDIVALGWHLDGHATFDEINRRIADHGVPAVEGTDEEAKLRGVERFLAVSRAQRAHPGDLHHCPHRTAVPGYTRQRIRHWRRRNRPRRPHRRRSRSWSAATTTMSSTRDCRTTSTRRSTG